jgi:uncharacterized protein (TIGR04551 family)
LTNLRSPLALVPSMLRHSLVPALVPALAVLLSTGAAWAQFGGQPGGMQPGGMGPQPGEEPRDEGPAEEAPEEEEQPRDLEPLGAYAGQARRTAQVVEIDGYLRLRTDFLHKLHLDQTYVTQALGGGGSTGTLVSRTPPFPVPLECPVADGRCSSKNLGSGNLRLRLEPTINVTDQVRVVAQVDVLDNTIMGSTPDSLVSGRLPGLRTDRAAASSLYTTQDPPEVGRNGLVTSIRAKRAWGEVDSEFGSLRFGRMPWHFGRGIAFNNGNCPDCEGGTNVDRLMGITQLYGHQVALSWDFGAQGHHIGMVDYGARDPGGGPPLDLSQRDDVLQLMLAITKLDDERRFQERAAQGELMFNYGLQLVYRELGQDIYDLTAEAARKVCPPGGMDNTCTPGTAAPLTHDDLNKSITANVDALVFLPSLWMKLGWRALTVEAEASGVVGKINDALPLVTDSDLSARKVDLQQLGWVVASELRLYRNAFFLGFETGGATGDQAEDPNKYLNYRWKFTKQPRGDRKIKDFKFSPEYHVDEILFRRILGTVTNAVYVKPQMTYWLDLAERRQVGLNAAFIYSMAMESVSTPGNALPYGVEMNLGLNYRNPSDGFYAGISWAVLWPMGALNRFQDGDRPAQDATSAQALRTFFGIRF